MTTDKIGGVISVTKLPIGNVPGTVAAGGHSHAGVYSQKYAFVVIVAKSGGDFTDPVDALESITDASQMKPYIVRIMPGVYDIGARQVSVKDHVTVEGSGREATKILHSTGVGVGSVVMRAGSNSEIRSITIESAVDGGGAYPLLLEVPIKTSVRLADVSLVLKSGGTAIRSDSSSLVLRDVSVSVTGGTQYGTCIANTAGSVEARGLECLSSAGLAGNGVTNGAGGSLVIKESFIQATGWSVSQNADGGFVHLAQTQVASGPLHDELGTLRCFSVFDGSLNPLACQ